MAALMCALLAVPVLGGEGAYTLRGDSAPAVRTRQRPRDRVALPGRRSLGLFVPGKTARPSAADRPFELQVGSTTVLIDPKADYRRQGVGVLDENNHLLVAQRLYRKLTAGRAYTVRGGAPEKASMAGTPIVPRLIIMKEDPSTPQRRVPVVPAPAPDATRDKVADARPGGRAGIDP